MLIEKYRTIQVFEPKTTNTAITSSYVDLKNTITAVSHCKFSSSSRSWNRDFTISIKGYKGILENNVPILANEDVSKSNELIRKSEGVIQ